MNKFKCYEEASLKRNNSIGILHLYVTTIYSSLMSDFSRSYTFFTLYHSVFNSIWSPLYHVSFYLSPSLFPPSARHFSDLFDHRWTSGSAPRHNHHTHTHKLFGRSSMWLWIMSKCVAPLTHLRYYLLSSFPCTHVLALSQYKTLCSRLFIDVCMHTEWAYVA